ncbi:MAG TPA: glutamine-hydrolyzing carbamoyl-phosphate synthase small subunit [Thermoplasmata archaeon]|nr:glutamine-hydrolyzing carbamoyl-phosphate synthase small subunit [Thermoplasmata archaeon]
MPEEVAARAQVGHIELEDGTILEGHFFGAAGSAEGEVVFNTGMVGYVESLTDPSYRGQILVLTYPLIGNYGVPSPTDAPDRFESDRIQVRGLVVADYIPNSDHWEAAMTLGEWMAGEGIVGLSGVDTRLLTRRLRSEGTMLGRILPGPSDGERPPFEVADPNATDLVAEVTCRDAMTLGGADAAGPHIVVVDCGCKRSIVRELLARDCRVTIVPYDHDMEGIDCDGVLISNGPGDPAMCQTTANHVATLLDRRRPVPVAGICLGCQIMAIAAGATTFKLPYGHRSQNQPCHEVGTDRYVITSQNHGYAVDPDGLPDGWAVWYTNLSDGTVEGIRHSKRPFMAVQFHPEGSPGPTDTRSFFDMFLGVVRRG